MLSSLESSTSTSGGAQRGRESVNLVYDEDFQAKAQKLQAIAAAAPLQLQPAPGPLLPLLLVALGE